MIHTIDFPGVGELEALPNGDAVFFTDLLGVTPSLREAGRYALRWPGWCDFLRRIKGLGLLSDEAVAGLTPPLTPHQMMVRVLAPRLQYANDEKDIVAMVNVFEGLKDGRGKRLEVFLLIERDLRSGLFGMSLGVGFAASIAAQMLAAGEIRKKGVLSPAVDIPHVPFMAALAERGIVATEKEAFE
jgi:saccharopine dehydrogenase-like NADP-dependent oxidoreductase